jgi:cbb3-type cytochrome oxidase subunit 3
LAQLAAAPAAAGSAGPQRLLTLFFINAYMYILRQQGKAAADAFLLLLTPDELSDLVVVMDHGMQLLQQIREGAQPQ